MGCLHVSWWFMVYIIFHWDLVIEVSKYNLAQRHRQELCLIRPGLFVLDILKIKLSILMITRYHKFCQVSFMDAILLDLISTEFYSLFLQCISLAVMLRTYNETPEIIIYRHLYQCKNYLKTFSFMVLWACKDNLFTVDGWLSLEKIPVHMTQNGKCINFQTPNVDIFYETIKIKLYNFSQ